MHFLRSYGVRAWSGKGWPCRPGAPIRWNDQIVGAVSVGKPVQSFGQFLQSARDKLLVVAITSAACVILLALLVSVWLVRPVRPDRRLPALPQRPEPLRSEGYGQALPGHALVKEAVATPANRGRSRYNRTP